MHRGDCTGPQRMLRDQDTSPPPFPIHGVRVCGSFSSAPAEDGQEGSQSVASLFTRDPLTLGSRLWGQGWSQEGRGCHRKAPC